MFEHVLLESSFSKTHRGGATFVSFALLIALMGALVVLPLLFIQALPKQELVTFLVAPPPPPPPPPAATKVIETPKRPVHSEVLDTGQLRAPSRIPKKIAMIKESSPPPPAVNGVVGGVPGGVPGGELGGVIGSIIRSTPVAQLPKLAAPKPVQPQRVRVSQGVTDGLLIRQVKPRYPAIAREARIEGPVVLKAIISRDGTIQHLVAESGNPVLVPAAIDAVKDWRYRPYLLNGTPVEVETQITIFFHLG